MQNEPMFFQILGNHEVFIALQSKASMVFFDASWGVLIINKEVLSRTGEL